jgi:D-alanyl-D-alanine carboxypeptidase/D-alanyl-D-alanine-endopeptidase (penicillin-binding protein 4)
MRQPLLALLALAATVTARGDDLPPEVERVLAGHSIPADHVSVIVQAVGEKTPVVSHRPDVPRNPASVMKMVTTWSALEILGPSYTWPTEVYYLGPFDGRTLDGTLAIKGYGDPYLVLEEFWKMLRALRITGLEHVKGDLLLDASHFDVVEPDPGAFDDQPYRTYNVVPSALLVNFKAVSFQFFVDEAAGRLRIVPEPPLPNLEIRNEVKLGSSSCGGYQRGISFTHADPAALDRVVFGGTYSRRCNAYAFSRTVLQHETYAYGLFQTLWRELGGQFSGSLRTGRVPEGAVPVLKWRSPPLGEVIRSINKNSNNVMTRQLLYTLGAERYGAPGTRPNGIKAVHDFLTSRHLDTSSLVLQNGAGLSRDERISARLLVDILLAAETSPYAAEFIASLSLGGMDGTTRGRFGGGPRDDVLHVKTGRIDHVSALAGYVHGKEGQTYVIAILVNTPEAHRGPGKEIEEAVIRWVRSRL